MEKQNRNRILILIQGVLLLALGFYTLAHPGAAILTMALFFRWFLMITGIFTLLTAFAHEKGSEIRKSHFFEGFMLIILALIFMFSSSIASAAILIYMVIGWFIYSSIASIIYSFTLRSGIFRIISILLSVIVIYISIQSLFDPALAAGIFVFTLAFNFILLGINEILLVFTIKK